MKIVKEKTTLDLCEKGDDEITLFGGRILILKILKPDPHVSGPPGSGSGSTSQR